MLSRTPTKSSEAARSSLGEPCALFSTTSLPCVQTHGGEGLRCGGHARTEGVKGGQVKALRAAPHHQLALRVHMGGPLLLPHSPWPPKATAACMQRAGGWVAP